MGLFDRFKRHQNKSDEKPEQPQSPVDRPLIGSSLFPDSPQTPREIMRPARLAVQANYRAEGRDPETLARVPRARHDLEYWLRYVDALMVFEREEEALPLVKDLLEREPAHPLLREMEMLLEAKLGLRPPPTLRRR